MKITHIYPYPELHEKDGAPPIDEAPFSVSVTPSLVELVTVPAGSIR